VVYVRSLHLGPEDLFVEAKVVFDPELRAADVAAAIDRMEGAIRERVEPARVVAIEPDTGGHGDPEVPAYERDADQRP
jgi:divalent metal cation (Fe/Co/Zn/Cd) transporter